MSFIKNIKFLFELIKYTRLGFSVCKIYQVLELKKQKIQEEVIEFGSNNYEESLIKFNKKKTKKIYFSNIFKNKDKNKNYISLDLENKNKENIEINIDGIRVNKEKYVIYFLFEVKPSLSMSFLIDFLIS